MLYPQYYLKSIIENTTICIIKQSLINEFRIIIKISCGRNGQTWSWCCTACLVFARKLRGRAVLLWYSTGFLLFFKIEVLLKFTSGIIYQFQSLKNSTPFITYRVSAISTTARKLAVIIWNMVVKKVPYIPQTEHQFLDQKRKKNCCHEKTYC